MVITNEGIRIDVPLLNCLHRRDTVVTDCYLKLYDRYLEYKCVGSYLTDERIDFEGIWTDTKTNYRWTRMRAMISQVDMYYDNPQDKWMVSVEFTGISDPTGWLFEDPKQALKVYNQLQDYLISR